MAFTEYRIKVVLSPRHEGVEESADGRLIVSVRAKREKGMANTRACQLLAKYFSVEEGAVSIVRGHTLSSKIVRLRARPPITS